MNKSNNKYDLEERTAVLGEDVIEFCRKLPQDAISRPIISQIVRSSTSIGANYMEANSASSRKDFCNKIYICKKEAQETKHWLRMITKCFPDKRIELQKLSQETTELTLIFGRIIVSTKKNL